MEQWVKFQPQSLSDDAAALFAWRGGEIALFGEYADGRWVLARGWRRPDPLSDVRRWSFPTPEQFVGQVRRLALEAVGDRDVAEEAAEAAAAWTARIAAL